MEVNGQKDEIETGWTGTGEKAVTHEEHGVRGAPPHSFYLGPIVLLRNSHSIAFHLR